MPGAAWIWMAAAAYAVALIAWTIWYKHRTESRQEPQIPPLEEAKFNLGKVAQRERNIELKAASRDVLSEGDKANFELWEVRKVTRDKNLPTDAEREKTAVTADDEALLRRVRIQPPGKEV